MEQDVRSQMQEAVEERRNVMATAGERLSELAAQQADLEERLSVVRAQYKAAWNGANRVGWSDAQLRAFGFKRPITTQRRRSKQSVGPTSEG